MAKVLCDCEHCEAVTAKALSSDFERVKREVEARYGAGFFLCIHGNPCPSVSPDGRAFVAGWQAGKEALMSCKSKAHAYALGVVSAMPTLRKGPHK